MTSQVPVVTVLDGASPVLAAPVTVFGLPYALASNIALGANAGSTPVANVRGGNYVLDAQWTGTATVKLQALGADGATWRDVATLSAPGTFAGEIRIGANATLRVFATAAVTALYASVS